MKWYYYVIGIAVVVAFGVIAYFLFFLDGSKTNTESTTTVTTTPESTPASDAADEEETIQLKAVGDYTGDGTATRNYDGEIFTHTVNANIDDPATGKFYEGWLVNMSKTPPFFSTGNLEKEGNVYKLTYTSDTDYTDYTMVVITEETSANGNDNIPEAHVLEGLF